MSIDSAFSPVTFPALRNRQQDAADTRSRASGHAAGYAAGLRAASDEVAARAARFKIEHDAAIQVGRQAVELAVSRFRAATDALNARTVPLLEDAQDAILSTAIDLAEAIIGRELGNEQASAQAAVRRALSGVNLAVVHSVRMNPADLALLGDTALVEAGVTFVPDATLSHGDAITEFPNGYLDARVRDAFNRAKAAILEQAP